MMEMPVDDSAPHWCPSNFQVAVGEDKPPDVVSKLDITWAAGFGKNGMRPDQMAFSEEIIGAISNELKRMFGEHHRGLEARIDTLESRLVHHIDMANLSIPKSRATSKDASTETRTCSAPSTLPVVTSKFGKSPSQTKNSLFGKAPSQTRVPQQGYYPSQSSVDTQASRNSRNKETCLACGGGGCSLCKPGNGMNGITEDTSEKAPSQTEANPVQGSPSSALNVKKKISRQGTVVDAGIVSQTVLARQRRERTGLSKMVRSAYFDYIFGSFIMLNSVLIGFQTDYQAKNVNSPEDQSIQTMFRYMDMAFCFIFLVELVLRVGADRMHYFLNPEWRWSLFDVSVVALAVVEEVLILYAVIAEDGVEDKNSNLSFVRVLRGLRLVRVVRVVRVLRFFRELRIMVNSIMSTVKSLVWTLTLLLTVLYIFGVYITQAVSDHRTENHDTMDSDLRRELNNRFGSFISTLLSLYQAVMGGLDWDSLVAPLLSISPLLGFTFVLYVTFVVFTVFNVITGVFVDQAGKAAERDLDTVIQEELYQRELYLSKISQMFHEADMQETGSITLQDLEEHMKDLRVRAYFKTLELDVGEVRTFFQMLDPEKTGFVDIDAFINGCMRLRGHAKNVDIAAMRYEQQVHMRRWAAFAELMEEGINKLTLQAK